MKNIFTKHPITPLYWILLAVIVIYFDYLTGPVIQFPIFYLIPVLLASWYHGLRWGMGLSLLLACTRPFMAPLWSTPHWSTAITLINALSRGSVFVLVAILINRIAKQQRTLEQEVKTLKGILPICTFCKKIHNSDDTWTSLEEYISSRSEAKFSHGLCPDCLKKHYPDYVE